MATKYKRKHYFINPKFQTRFLVSFVVPMLIFLSLISFVMMFAAKNIVTSTIEIVGEDIHGIVRSNEMHIQDTNKRNGAIVKQIKEYVVNNISNKSSVFSSSILKSASGALLIGLFVVVLQLALLTVFVSHKIAGPIYRFEKFSEALESGNLSDRIHLRNGDQLIDTADKFNKMAELLEDKIVKAQDLINRGCKTNEKLPDTFKEAQKILNSFKTS